MIRNPDAVHETTTGAGRDEPTSFVFSRRDLLTLAGSAFVLVACGGKSPRKAPITVSSPVGSSPPVASPARASASSASSGAIPPSSDKVVTLGGPHATGNDAMSVADAQREAQIANGRWLGGWHDAMGRSGNSDVVIAIDGANRTATASVSFAGDLLDGPIPPVTYDIDLLSFMLTADSYDVVSPQFGHVNIVPGGSGGASGMATMIPGQPTIDHIEVSGSLVTRRADATYTVHYTDGHSVKGTMAWTAGGSRATPAALGATGSSTTPAEIQNGNYAASLLDAQTLATIFGEPFKAPQPNGGKLNYDAGISISNGQAYSTSGNYVVQYAVSIGESAAQTDAFWAKQKRGQPTTPGPWKEGFYYREVATFYADFPTRVVTVQIVALKATGSPTAADQETQQQRTVAIATAIATSLGKT